MSSSVDFVNCSQSLKTMINQLKVAVCIKLKSKVYKSTTPMNKQYPIQTQSAEFVFVRTVIGKTVTPDSQTKQTIIVSPRTLLGNQKHNFQSMPVLSFVKYWGSQRWMRFYQTKDCLLIESLYIDFLLSEFILILKSLSPLLLYEFKEVLTSASS